MAKKPKITHEVTQTHRFARAEGLPSEYHGVDFQMIRRETTEHGDNEGETIVTRYVDGAISFSDRTAEAFALEAAV